MNILTTETAQQIYAGILATGLIVTIVVMTVQAWRNYNKTYGREYQETNYCNNFNKQFNKPNFTLVEDGNSFKVGVAG